jgi:long-chain acyl-CoA synthetase
LHPGASVSTEELIAHCRARLTPYKVPRQVEFREALPKSPIGKILRRALERERTGQAA